MTTKAIKSKNRAANYNADELECILSHLEVNPGLLDARVGGQFSSSEEYKQAWTELAEKVSEVGGCFGVKRTGLDVKKKWSDLKHRVKTKVANIAMESQSGIHGTSAKLSPVDERVFALISELQESQPDRSVKYNKQNKDAEGPSIRVLSFQQESNSNVAENSDQEDDDDAETSQIQSELVNEIKATSSQEKKRRISQAFNAANDRGGIQLKRAKQSTDEEQLLELCVSQKQIINELSSMKDILKKCQVSIEKLAILKRAELQLKCAKHGVEFDDLFN